MSVKTPRVFSFSRARFFNRENPKHPGWALQPGQVVNVPLTCSYGRSPVLQWDFFCVKLLQETILFSAVQGVPTFGIPLVDGRIVDAAELEFETGLLPEPFGLHTRSLDFNSFVSFASREPHLLVGWGSSYERRPKRALSVLRPFLLRLRDELALPDPSVFVSEFGDEGIPRFWFVPTATRIPLEVQQLLVGPAYPLYHLNEQRTVSAYRLKSQPLHAGYEPSPVLPWSVLRHGSVVCGLLPESGDAGEPLAPATTPTVFSEMSWRSRPYVYAGDEPDGVFPQRVVELDTGADFLQVEFA